MNPDTQPTLPETQPQPQLEPQPPRQRRVRQWQFWLPLALQALLLLAVPARDAYTMANGTPIVLQTAPVDPYDLLRGYYQTLSYEISAPAFLQELPGGQQVFAEWRNKTAFDFYVILEPPQTPVAPGQRPQPWVAVRVSEEPPDDLTANQVALQGEYRNWSIRYGLETYYMPEDQREAINDEIRQIQQENPESFVVNVKVDDRGHGVPVSLWVSDRLYQF
jgi:uncharacterized membrane-anchored protein